MTNSIYKRGRIWWWKYRAHGVRGKTLTESLGTPDKQAAEKRRSERLAEVEREQEGIIAPKRMREAAKQTTEKHLDDFEADLRARGRVPKYIDNLSMRIRKLIEDCGWKQLHEITADSFVAWRSRQQYSAKTLVEYQNAMSGFLYWLRRNGRIAVNSLEFVGKPELRGHQTRQRRGLSLEEGRALLKVAGPHAVVYRMVFYTGLRRGELEKLEWSDVHLDDAVEPFVNVRASTTKNHERTVRHLPPDLAGELRQLKAQSGSETGRALKVPSVEELHADLKLAGIPTVDALGRVVDFHALRMTACTWLQIAGVSQRSAMEFMRHSDRRLTDQVYTDASLLQVKAATQTLHNLVNGVYQGLYQNLGASGHAASQPVIEVNGGEVDGTSVNVGQSHDVTQAVTNWLERKWRAQQELNLPKTAHLPSESAGTVPRAVPNKQVSAELTEVVTAWHSLAEPLKAAVLAIVRSSAGGGNNGND